MIFFTVQFLPEKIDDLCIRLYNSKTYFIMSYQLIEELPKIPKPQLQ